LKNIIGMQIWSELTLFLGRSKSQEMSYLEMIFYACLAPKIITPILENERTHFICVHIQIFKTISAAVVLFYFDSNAEHPIQYTTYIYNTLVRSFSYLF